MGQIFSCTRCNKNKRDNEPLDFDIGVELKQEKGVENASYDESDIDSNLNVSKEKLDAAGSVNGDNNQANRNSIVGQVAENNDRNAVTKTSVFQGKELVPDDNKVKLSKSEEIRGDKQDNYSDDNKDMVEGDINDQTKSRHIPLPQNNDFTNQNIDLENSSNKGVDVDVKPKREDNQTVDENHFTTLIQGNDRTLSDTAIIDANDEARDITVSKIVKNEAVGLNATTPINAQTTELSNKCQDTNNSNTTSKTSNTDSATEAESNLLSELNPTLHTSSHEKSTSIAGDIEKPSKNNEELTKEQEDVMIKCKLQEDPAPTNTDQPMKNISLDCNEKLNHEQILGEVLKEGSDMSLEVNLTQTGDNNKSVKEDVGVKESDEKLAIEPIIDSKLKLELKTSEKSFHEQKDIELEAQRFYSTVEQNRDKDVSCSDSKKEIKSVNLSKENNDITQIRDKSEVEAIDDSLFPPVTSRNSIVTASTYGISEVVSAARVAKRLKARRSLSKEEYKESILI